MATRNRAVYVATVSQDRMPSRDSSEWVEETFVRLDWAAEYRGPTTVVYGHTPVPEPEWFNRTVNIDTGCVFGGKLTALRYPEKEFVAVDAKHTYCEPAKPFIPDEEQAPWDGMLEQEKAFAEQDDMLVKAVEIVRDTQRASASMLQRRLRIGYPRAARLIDQLEEMGVIGPSQKGGRDREVIIGLDDEIPQLPVDPPVD